MNETLHFAQPAWIAVGVIISLLMGILLQLQTRKQQAALQRFASGRLLGQLVVNVSRKKRLFKTCILCLATLLSFVALARPQYGSNWLEVQSRGIDLLFGLDTSKSMLTRDIRPSRLQRARLAILDFLEEMHGDRVGLLPFAGSSYLMCPLTLDYSAFAETLAEVNTEIIPQGGTNIGTVIKDAEKILNVTTNHKILILLTDGENLQGDVLQAAKEAGQNGLTIYTIGVGTQAGELIPDITQGGFLKDKTGKFISSKLDENGLKQIAELTGGLYVPLGSSDEGLQTIYRERLQHLSKNEREERKKQVPIERFGWPLGMALFLFLLELLLLETRRKPMNWRLLSLKRLGKKSSATIAILLLLATIPRIGHCSSYGEEAFGRQEYLQASEYYRKQLEKRPDDPKLNYNFGAAAYKNNMFDDAIQAFQKALKSDDVQLQKDTYYNLGNSYFHKGKETSSSAVDQTRKSWQQALDSYDAALKLAPKDADAKHNRELVARKLKKLEKQQQKQQNQQNQDKNKHNSKKKDSGTSDKKDSEKSAENETKSPAADQSAQQDKQNKQKAPTPDESDQKQQAQKPAVAENSDRKTEKANNSDEQSPPQTSPANRKAQPRTGTLSKQEAEQLLNSLKAEEGVLNFLPSSSQDENIERDW